MTTSTLNGYSEALELLVPVWPKEAGSRQTLYRALIGGLIRADFSDIDGIVEHIVEATEDEELDKRLEIIDATRDRIAAKEPTAGWPKLAKQIGDQPVSDLRRILGLSVSVADLAKAKKIPENVLQGFGLRDGEGHVVIEYRNKAGKVVVEKRRTRLSGNTGSRWPKGKQVRAYGEDRLGDSVAAGYLIIVEGESDCWTLWHHGLPAVGLPGNESVNKTLKSRLLENLSELIVVEEADDGGAKFVENVRKRLLALGWKGTLRVVALDDANDVSELHCDNPEQFETRWKDALDEADKFEIDPSTQPGEASATAEDAPKKSIATLLVELVEASGAELFHNPDGDPFATFETNGHKETWPLNSMGFKRWLKRRFYLSEGKAPNANGTSDAMGVLEGKACFEGDACPVHLRIAGQADKLYLDLCNDAWQVVEIGADGWRVVDNSPVRFRRSRGMLPLPKPEQGTSLDELRELVNVASEEDWHLLVGWLVATLRPTGPYPLLVLTGEQGTAKSTLGRILRLLVDPARAMLRSDPSDTRDLMIAANNGWVVSYDNLSWIPSWLSDALCRLATGGGFGTRQLYTDDEEMLFDSVRPAMLTSIEDVVTASDLLDRSIFLRLKPIPDEKRRTEEELNAEIDRRRPGILGALLTAVSGGLRLLPQADFKKLPRMADFGKWAEVVWRGLGADEDEFVDAYNANRKDVNELALEVSPIVPVLMRALEALEDREITDTPSKIFEWLTGEATDEEKKQRGWPKKSNKCSGLLRRSAPNLRRLGYEIDLDKKGPRPKQERLMYFKAPPEGEREGNLSSPSSPSSPQEPNPFENSGLRGDDNNTSDRPPIVPKTPDHPMGTIRGRYGDDPPRIYRPHANPLKQRVLALLGTMGTMGTIKSCPFLVRYWAKSQRVLFGPFPTWLESVTSSKRLLPSPLIWRRPGSTHTATIFDSFRLLAIRPRGISKSSSSIASRSILRASSRRWPKSVLSFTTAYSI